MGMASFRASTSELWTFKTLKSFCCHTYCTVKNREVTEAAASCVPQDGFFSFLVNTGLTLIYRYVCK